MSDNQPVPEALADMLSRSTAPLALLLNDAVNWWDTVNRSVVWQDRIFHLLAALYGLVTAVALVQLVRIQLRVPEYGWTTQKVFHFLNFLVNAVRCLVFIFRRDIQDLEPEIFQHVILDLPSLAFFTTYALLVLFWAEIYYQARAVSTDWLGPTFYTINGVVYAIQIILWVVQWWKPIHATVVLSRMFFAGVSLFAALGFILYGGRLFLMLQRFPVESKGRRKKLQEVGYMTTICFSCFLIRSIMYLIFELLVFAICASNTAPRLHETGYLPTSIYAYGMCFNALQTAADLDVLDHPVLNFIYYFLVEILPSALILFILRKLPPRRGITQYHPIR